MQIKTSLSIAFTLIFLTTYSQEKLLALTIDDEMKENSNAVVRLDDNLIEVKAHNRLIYSCKRIITILNKRGNSDIGAVVHYNNNINIRKLEAVIYNAFGKEIKKVKKKDFVDVSAVSGGTLYSDSRIKYLDHTPINYPYTLVIEKEIEYKSTAFVPGWRPIEGFYVSTENASYKIINTSGVNLKVKTTNFENYDIEEIGEFDYSAKNLKAIKGEAYAPAFKSYAPFLRVALTKFTMEGVDGVNTNWSDFGKWMNDELVSDTQELPQAVKDEVKSLTKNETADMEKAKLIYKYMQDKTRYISVQVGIGGWKPMLANDVDRLGYGDCKALTNYTKALLDEVNVESYYTVIYGDNDLRSIDKDFSATEGNHVILAIPNEEDYVWLECTSQTSPFGYNANFTDDRDALVITPEGGKIIHTKVYETKGNLQTTNAKVKLDEHGNISAQVQIASEGTQYDHYVRIEDEDEKGKRLYYKEYFDNINNLEVLDLSLDNNKEDIIFTENVDIAASKYASKAGDRILVAPNMFNRKTYAPPRYKNRKMDFEVDRGYMDVDEYEIALPETLEIEALMTSVNIKNEFGEYKVSIEMKSDNLLVYKRMLVMNKGQYKKEEYSKFRDFHLKIIKHDKSKIALKRTN